MRAALICVVALGLMYQISAECANACSGHGVCRNSDQCDCFPNYAAADCSQRVCPYGLAWVDNPRGDLDHDGLRDTNGNAGNPIYSSGNLGVPVYTFTNGHSVSSSSAVTVYDWESFNPNAQTDEGHYYSECSNKGLCDRSSGLCVCFDGYTGSSCQRTTCPNDCSGHGICRTVDEVAAGDLPNSVAAGSSLFTTTTWGGLNKRETDNRAGYVFYEGVATSTLYRLWDQDMSQTCVCDPGYSGADCSRRECPRGDDPLTHRNAECPVTPGLLTAYSVAYGGDTCRAEVQTILFTGAANKADWVHFLFRDWTGKIWKTEDVLLGVGTPTGCGTLPVTATDGGATLDDALAEVVKNALMGIPNGIIPDVEVDATASSGNNIQLAITFTGNPGNIPVLVAVNSADMQLNLPQCTDTTVDFTVTYPTTAGAQVNGNKELSTCSNRGICDYDSGLCKCFKGYYGGDCSFQNSLSQ